MKIKQIIKEEIDSFDWADEIPPKFTVDQLKKGDIYIYNHPTGAQFRIKYNHAPGITNKWGTTTTYAFDWMKDGQRINFNAKEIQKNIDNGNLVKESNDFEWVSETKPYFKLERNVDYYIDFCETPFNENEVYSKITDLIGNEWELRGNRHINWFDNNNIERDGHKVLLHFNLTTRGIGIEAGWERCELRHTIEKGSTRITPEQFFTSIIE
jgi:hypothetical protein